MSFSETFFKVYTLPPKSSYVFFENKNTIKGYGLQMKRWKSVFVGALIILTNLLAV